ncbi:DUF58 domain-containing protein [Crassaminicella profunda]|uniref:DUF58 domain-containing protein n=1 Tax=Crassaminicella profunda TaxID=1286698 RepID=UPI001CA5F9E6|nr:DUF58 domain-containing protein [Crassaminicella profunda]QZY55687.1 DUF58 domain-containing protein [Crassaminicella profunda]
MDAFLKEIEGLKILPRKRLLKGGKGNYKGQGFGNSLDFYGHREYLKGDDIRKIDWKAYTRTEKFYIKEFTEERQMHVNIILDMSASMDFGLPNKWEIAKKYALGMSYLTLKQNDYLSFYTLNNELRSIQKNIKGKEYFYELLKIISNNQPKGVTDFSSISGVDHFMSGMTFIISDCFGNGLEKVLNLLCVGGQEVVLIHVLSADELNPNHEEELKLIDVETGDIRRIHFNDRVKEIYIRKMKAFIELCKNVCTSREVRYVLAPTDKDAVEMMTNLLGGF